MLSALVAALRKRHIVDEACAVQPAGGVGQLVTDHTVEGRAICTAPIDALVPVFFTVNEYTVPAELM
jgi:hypothetical protein